MDPMSDENRFSNALSLLPPKTYLVGEIISAGGFGKVYKGSEISTGKAVAIKVFEGGDKEVVKRLEREVGVLKRASDSGVAVGLLDSFFSTEKAAAVLVFEFLSGSTLEHFVAKTPVRESVVAAIAIQLCEGLEKIHKQGIVHRDIKPTNIMITLEGRVVFLDFGIAVPAKAANPQQDWEEDITQQGFYVGTPRYSAPEAFSGEDWSYASDVFSLGMTILTVLLGRHPLEGSEGSGFAPLFREMLAADFPSYIPESLRPRWQQIIGGALMPEPKDRISISEMLELLRLQFPKEAKIATTILAENYVAVEFQDRFSLPLIQPASNNDIASNDHLIKAVESLASQINEVQAAVADVTIIVRKTEIEKSRDETKIIKRQPPEIEGDPVLKTFATVRHRLEVNWKVSLVMTLVLFFLFVGMLILAVVFSVIYQHSYLGFVFGGTSALSLLTVVLWKPMDKMLFATVATQQLELIQLNYQRAINGNRQERREAYRDVNDQINALLTKLTKPTK